MFRIYITAKALAEVCLQEQSKEYKDQSAWFRILCRQDEIYTIGYTPPSTDTIGEDDLSDSAIIAGMNAAYNINFIPKDGYIRAVKREHSNVYQQPNAAFFLDISDAEAQQIQDEYGVICQSVDNIDASVFTEECVRFEFVKNKIVKGGWSDLFEVQSNIPSNSLCIIDRFLFAYDGQNNPNAEYSDEIIYNGLDTILLILAAALPNTFKNTYHVTIVCDKKQIKNRLIFQTLQQHLWDRVSVISHKKGYPIFAQLIAIDGEVASYTHRLTHNRQIISNYHRMFFLNGINAIRLYSGSAGMAEYQQTVQGELLYGAGLRHQNSECPVQSVESTQSAFKYVLRKWRTSYEPDHYYYADNEGNSSIRNFKNRLFS